MVLWEKNPDFDSQYFRVVSGCILCVPAGSGGSAEILLGGPGRENECAGEGVGRRKIGAERSDLCPVFLLAGKSAARRFWDFLQI